MLSKIINIRKTPILYFAFPYEKIDPLPFQLLLMPLQIGRFSRRMKSTSPPETMKVLNLLARR